jgi:hypothetical protein
VGILNALFSPRHRAPSARERQAGHQLPPAQRAAKRHKLRPAGRQGEGSKRRRATGSNVGNGAGSRCCNEVGELDVDMDGKQDTIALLDYASGAGCGSYRQWLIDATAHLESSMTTSLNSVLENSVWGPITGVTISEPWFSVRLLQHQGKPYILSKGTDSKAKLASVWERQLQTWCEYKLLPQHRHKGDRHN